MHFWRSRKAKAPPQPMRVGDEMKNPHHVGEQLLCTLKSCDKGNGPTTDKDLLEDCVELECTRKSQDPGPREASRRMAHRCVLRACSPYFREQLRTRRDIQCLDIDATSGVLDLALEYMYTNKTICLHSAICVQLYAIAKMLRLDDMAKDVREFIRSNMKGLLEDPDFLSRDRLIDVQLLSDVFKELAADVEIQLRLVRRLHHWFSTLGDASPVDSDQNRLFSTLVGNVLSVKRADDSLQDDDTRTSQMGVELPLQPPPPPPPVQSTKKPTLRERIKKTLRRAKRKEKID